MLALEVTKDQSVPAVLRAIDALLSEQFGTATAVPAGLELRTDHGPQYTGQDCAELIDRWALTHTLAPVGRPTGNAVVERVIRTMDEGGGDLAPGLGGRGGTPRGARGVAAALQRDAPAPGPRLADAGGVPRGEAGRGDGRGRVSEKTRMSPCVGELPLGQPEALRGFPCVALSAPHPTLARTASRTPTAAGYRRAASRPDFRRAAVSCSAGNTTVTSRVGC